MRHRGVDFARTLRPKQRGALNQGAGGVHFVVDDEGIQPIHFAD
jgi:hypothetical protein